MTGLVLGAALLLSGCAGSSDPETPPVATTAAAGDEPAAPEAATAPGAEPDAGDTGAGGDVVACDLLSAEEIDAALGTAVQEGSTFAEPACAWLGSGTGVSVNLVFRPLGDAQTCLRTRVGQTSDVAGLGDEAWWEFVEASSANVGTVTVCIGGDQVGLTAAGDFEEAPLREGMEELVRSVVGRL